MFANNKLGINVCELLEAYAGLMKVLFVRHACAVFLQDDRTYGCVCRSVIIVTVCRSVQGYVLTVSRLKLRYLLFRSALLNVCLYTQ